MYPSVEVRNHEIDFGATLSPIALRNLYDHSAVHLNAEWPDLPADSWHYKVQTVQGRVVPAEETVWMRTREVRVHAVDLDNGASFDDIPAPGPRAPTHGHHWSVVLPRKRQNLDRQSRWPSRAHFRGL
ncbi:uncharacterized protein (TIGR03083 family) [Pseudarthrobacter defluvii]|uniref:Uncharacterized protein (TIGR03083 family) n=1 Tax=Pseudarthrobacter defluvii TaxID=410837 RepID=A0ABT9UNY5_9MICC|nr:uncharacterized protein (TIGR03083 family) [Pseudarthrobacter defluvii]